MGIRFSKRVTLFPGFRLNLGKKGVSVTIGPRGYSIGIGKQGVFSNLSIPGTGFSFRTKLFNSRTTSQVASYVPHFNITSNSLGNEFRRIKPVINENYELIIVDENDCKLSGYEEKNYRKENRLDLLIFLKNYVENFNQELKLSIYQYHLTPKPNDNLFNLPDFLIEQPSPPNYIEKSTVAQWLGIGKKVDLENDRLKRIYDNEKAQWDKLRKSYLNNKKNFLVQLYAAQTGNVEAMENTLRNLLHEIQWEKETIISFEISKSGDKLSVDVDLPEIEDIPHKELSVIERGLKLNIRNKDSEDIKHDYKQCVFSILFRITGFIFCALPTIRKLDLSGYTQRIDNSTGHEKDVYIVSVIIARDQWENINFDLLEKIDPFYAFQNFNLKCEIGKDGNFDKIVPF